MGLVMAVVLFFMRRSYPPSIRGLREWAWGPLLCFLSTVMFALRGVVPDAITVVLANGFLFQGCILYYAGSQLFLGRKRDTWRWTALNVVMAVVLAWFTWRQPDYSVRLAVFTAAVSALFIAHARQYLHHGVKDFDTLFMTGILMMQATVAGVRCVSALGGLAGNDLLEATWVQSLYIVMYSLTALFMSIAGVLMATDRVRVEFEFLASHDPLTGVLNRRAVLGACEAQLARCQRFGGSMALLMIDVDHFKSVNDTYGHLTGDEVLREIVARLQRALPPQGTLGRYGGEEFLALLPDADLQIALEAAEELRQQLIQPFQMDTTLAELGVRPLTVSMGIASYRGPTETIDLILARADEGLYRSKAMGRDRIEVTG
jgi:diguanylate cyclase (GGDEF)-like protein